MNADKTPMSCNFQERCFSPGPRTDVVNAAYCGKNWVAGMSLEHGNKEKSACHTSVPHHACNSGVNDANSGSRASFFSASLEIALVSLFAVFQT